MKNMTFRIQNQITKRVFTFEVTDLEDSRQYHHFSLQFDEDMNEGEYFYELFDEGGSRVSNGTLQIGDYTEENKDYNSTGNGEIRQYQG